MTDDTQLLGISNDRENWTLKDLDPVDGVALWRTDGPGHAIVVCNLNGWHVGLYTYLDVGPGLTLPIRAVLAHPPDQVATLVEEMQLTSEAIQEPDRQEE